MSGDAVEVAARTRDADILDEARRVLGVETTALDQARAALGGPFADLVRAALDCRGFVVVTGMGKSGIIGQKITATLVSTGTRAVFLHPADALHGDMGVIRSGDLVLALSNSGETEEIKRLIPNARRLGVRIAAITSNGRSTLANLADIAVVFPLAEEGCPLNLAPMASTTVSLALGDALAACLMVGRGFTRADFGQYHPSGALGKQLGGVVADVMVRDGLPVCAPLTPLREALGILVSRNLGAVLVLDGGRLAGILTDGDIKRVIDRDFGRLEKGATREVMTQNPVVCGPTDSLHTALRTMQARVITVLPVVNAESELAGLIRMHDILAFFK